MSGALGAVESLPDRNQPARPGSQTVRVATTIEPATAGDLPAIADIYERYVLTSAHTFDLEPRPMGTWCEWFGAFGVTGRHRLLAAREEGEIAGYAYSAPYRDRPAYAPSVVTSIYVAPDRTGQGVGTALYRELLGMLELEDVHRAYAAIALPNPASVRLHQRLGFHRAGYYSEQGRKFGRYWDVATYERAF